MSIKQKKINHFANVDSSGLKNGDRISAQELKNRTGNNGSPHKPSLLIKNKKDPDPVKTKPVASKKDRFLGEIKKQYSEWRDLFSCGISDYLKKVKSGGRKDAEYFEQASFMYYVATHYPELRYRIHASPNGASRKSDYEAWRLNVAGLSKGWPDVELLKVVSPYSGLFIEFKKKFDDYSSLKNALGQVSKEQHLHRKALNDEGYLAVVCYGCDEAIAVLNAYLNQTELPVIINNRWLQWDCEELVFIEAA